MSEKPVESGQHHKIDFEELKERLRHFHRHTQSKLAAAPPAAAPAAANNVEVQPGGATFPTIGAALASISDATQEKQYILYVGPGTYNEQVTLKPWCHISGADPTQTTISAPPGSQQWQRGTVVAASNSSIGNCTITSIGGGWGSWPCAVAAVGAAPFGVANCNLQVQDSSAGGANMAALAINDVAAPGPTSVYVSYCNLTSTGQASSSMSWGLDVNNGSYVEVLESKIVATGGSESWGGSSNGGANLNLFTCTVQGATWALNIPDYNSTVVATNCQLTGPVASGVKIVNDPPPPAAAKPVAS